MIKAIAIDDEPVALSIIESLVENIPFLSLEKSFSDAFEAATFIHNYDIDLLFLDVKMPDVSGIDFYQSLPKKPAVIFTTAYMQHAVKSYELDAIDYLLKPFSAERFLKACRKAGDFLEMQHLALKEQPRVLFLKSGYEQIKVRLNDIFYIESAGNYMTFVLADKKIVCRLTMQDTLNMLPGHLFVRVHRSYLVSKQKITKVDRNQVYIGRHTVPIGSIYAENAIKQIQSPD
ncbi:LytR/AlgR family response regulator transcription factor [Dyadobacter bucti]|uniref:LytR/AlgR family response regulator transcription factor n=1 Tax=Dyadobacter bucti TaxID=2572203 RepID=UPI003F723A22